MTAIEITLIALTGVVIGQNFILGWSIQATRRSIRNTAEAIRVLDALHVYLGVDGLPNETQDETAKTTQT